MGKTRSMNELSVYTEDGDIVICGQYAEGSPCSPEVRITPEQVDILAAWLKEARDELEAEASA